MAIIMRGGSSGMRSGDYLAPTPNYGVPQPVLNTASTQDCDANVHWYTENYRAQHVMHKTPDFMPRCGGLVPNSTDTQQQDISGIEPNI
jgi:hypothetical protein